MKFKNQSMVITGGGSGIGRATALELARHGGKIVVADIDEAKGRVTVDQIDKAGGIATFMLVNVAIDEDVRSVVDFCISTYGSLDHMINNAGIGRDLCYFDQISDDHWHDVIAINQTGVFYGMRAALKVMKNQGHGTIVNTASVAGIGAASRMGAYAASKHAVVGMTKTAAVEYGKYGIRVNAICPTIINTPMGEGYVSDNPEIVHIAKRSIPMRRFGEADEVAKTICWLCSEEASFINGQCIAIDGGMTS